MIAAFASAGGRVRAGGGRSPARTLAAAIDLAATCGCRAVQLSAADPRTKPRTLDRSAVRDIAAIIRRAGLICSGVDLFVPAAHLTSSETVDHAAESLAAAARFAADIAALTEGQPVLATSFPGPTPEKGTTPAAVVEAVAEAAARAGATIADHAFPSGAWHTHGVMAGVDPAAVILAGGDPDAAVADLAREGTLVTCRASDMSAEGRVSPGDGTLDPLAYAVTVAAAFRDTTPPPLVLDTRGLLTPAAGDVAQIIRRLSGRFGVTPRVS